MTEVFKSNEERLFWGMVNAVPQMLPDIQDGVLLSASYEAITLRLGGHSYTPDFLLHVKSFYGSLPILFEIKGSKKQKGYRETRVKLNEAATIYQMFMFYEVLIDYRSRSFTSFELISRPPFPYYWVVG